MVVRISPNQVVLRILERCDSVDGKAWWRLEVDDGITLSTLYTWIDNNLLNDCGEVKCESARQVLSLIGKAVVAPGCSVDISSNIKWPVWRLYIKHLITGGYE